MGELHTQDKRLAYLALRATLHTLRDMLMPEESVHLAAQLPLLLRSLYYEGGRPAGKPERLRSRKAFLHRVHDAFARAAPVPDPEWAARAVFVTLSRQVSEGRPRTCGTSCPRRCGGSGRRPRRRRSASVPAAPGPDHCGGRTMQLITRGELKALAEVRADPCVSVLLPTHVKGPDVRQGPVRLRNLLRQAEERIVQAGHKHRVAQEVLEPAARLVEDVDFWQHQAGGLVILLAPQRSRVLRVPLHLEELVVVTDRFHLKPLLALLAREARYYVLTLSQNNVRLLECTRFSEHEVDLTGTSVPRSIEDVVWADEIEQQLQFRTGVTGTGGRMAAVFHGHDTGDELKDALRRYFLHIDRGLQSLLGEQQAPLVLAGVEYLLPIYASVNTYPHLLARGVTGNPDQLRPEELRERAWALVEHQVIAAQQEAAERYHSLLGTGLASNRLEEVVSAAAQGRVDTLLVARGQQVWGRVVSATGQVETHHKPQPDDEDLLDYAAGQTLLHGGRVYPLEAGEMPDSAPAAAVLRY